MGAPRGIIYLALLDSPRVRDVDGADPHEQRSACVGRPRRRLVRISLTLDADPDRQDDGAHTDPFHNCFVKLMTNEHIVEVVEFEATDPELRCEMGIMIALADADGGTDVLAVND